MEATKYYSPILDELLDSITPEEQRRTENRMRISAKIEDLMKEQGLSQVQLAERLGKKPSLVSKWLSGEQNFTVETLSDIEVALATTFFRFDDTETKELHFHITIPVSTSKIPHWNPESFFAEPICYKFSLQHNTDRYSFMHNFE